MSETAIEIVPRGTEPETPTTGAGGLLLSMALNNAEQAARLLRIGGMGMAKWHLREALQQIDQAQQLSSAPASEPEPIDTNATKAEPQAHA